MTTILRRIDRPLTGTDFSPVAGSEQLPERRNADRRRNVRQWPGVTGRGFLLRAARLSQTDETTDTVGGVIFEAKRK